MKHLVATCSAWIRVLSVTCGDILERKAIIKSPKSFDKVVAIKDGLLGDWNAYIAEVVEPSGLLE